MNQTTKNVLIVIMAIVMVVVIYYVYSCRPKSIAEQDITETLIV